MVPRHRSPLFHAVVIAGVSLTQGACGSDEPSTEADAGTSSPAPQADAGSADATADAPTDAALGSDACPPGSELPVPPCALIR